MLKCWSCNGRLTIEGECVDCERWTDLEAPPHTDADAPHDLAEVEDDDPDENELRAAVDALRAH